MLRGEPATGTRAEGPCVFELPEATLVLPPGWRREVDERGDDPRPGRGRGRWLSGLDPVALQVLVGALRAACDEMGAVLIRSAHSPNIKERRDCSTALFDRRRRAGDAGRAHPGPPRLDARRGRRGARREHQRPATLWILNDPYRGGTHLPDITLISPVFAGGGGCSGSPPAAPTTRTSAARPRAGCRPSSTRLEEEGVVIPPTRADDDVLRELAEPDATTRPAARRPARPARRQPDRRAPPRASSPSATAPAGSRRRWPRSSTTPSAAPAPRSRSSPTARYEAADVLEGWRRRARLRVAADDRRRLARARLRRHQPTGRGQPQLPALGDQVGGLLRRPRAHRPRRPAVGGRPPAGRGDRARGLRCSTRGRRRRSRRATSRPRAGSPTWCWPRSRAPPRSRPRARGR